MAPAVGASGARRRLLNLTIGRTPLTIVVVVLVTAMLGVGYLVQRGLPTSNTSLEATWGGDPLTVAVGVDGMPLAYVDGVQKSGLWPDLFAQAPLADRSWNVLTVSESDAAAAVAADAADAALLPVVRGQSAFGLATSVPILSHSASLFASGPLIGSGALAEKSVAWFGAEGLVPVLLRLSAEPVGTMSVDDCLTRVLTGTVTACAVDEAVGMAHVAALGLEDRLVLVGSPVATIDYVLAWRPTDRVASQVLPRWYSSAVDSGLLLSLQKQWLGVRVQSAHSNAWSGTATGLGLALIAVSLVALGIGIRSHSLRNTISQRAQAMARSVPRHSAAFQATHDAVFVLDPRELTILEANARAYELTGYEPGRLIGTQFTEFVPARQRRLLRRSFLDDEPLDIPDLPLVHREGIVATVNLRSLVVPTDSGPERICLAADVTDGISARREVDRLADLSRRLIATVPLPLMVVDGAGRVLSANAGVTGLGFPDEVTGHPVDELLKGDVESTSSAIAALLARRDGSSETITVTLNNGKESSNRAILASLGENKNPWGALLVLTRFGDGASPGEKNQRLDVLSALGQVSGILAHDIRSRVSTASLGIQMLEEGFPPEHPDRQSVQMVREEIDYTMEVVDDILTLLRPGKVQQGACRVDEILERVVVAQAPLSHSSGVEVEAKLASGLPPVSGDPVQLERALGNLVKNAIEASPVDSVVRVTLDMVPGTGSTTTGELRICIVDQGAGIPPHIRGRLFEPYASEKRGGTGLGLSIVKKITDEHKGRIEVDSKVNRGTTFVVYLPVSGE